MEEGGWGLNLAPSNVMSNEQENTKKISEFSSDDFLIVRIKLFICSAGKG